MSTYIVKGDAPILKRLKDDLVKEGYRVEYETTDEPKYLLIYADEKAIHIATFCWELCTDIEDANYSTILKMIIGV